MAAITADVKRTAPATDPPQDGPPPPWTTGPPTADQSAQASRYGPAVRSWPLLVLAAPAAAEVWSGWVGIAQKTGFGLVQLLPGIWSSLHLDTAITLPVGVEAYAAYALRAWLASERQISRRTRRFAKWSAICSFALGMAGQVAYHLLTQAGIARAPWPITTIVSCLPVLVLGMGTMLAHMVHADNAAAGPNTGTTKPTMVRSTARSADRSTADQDQPDQDQSMDGGTGPPDRRARQPITKRGREVRLTVPRPRDRQAETDHARLIARELHAAGMPVSRRALRGAGVKGSNELLGAVARNLNAELADQV